MVLSSHENSFAPLHVCIGTYDGTVAGLSLTLDDEDSRALKLSTQFATRSHLSAVRSAAVYGNISATGGEDEIIRLYDVKARVEIGALFQHSGTVTSLSFSNDHGRRLLFSASADASICIWQVSNWRLLKRLVAHHSAIHSVAVHPTSTVALSVASDRSLFMWNLARGKVCFSAKTKVHAASAVLWSPSGLHYALVAGKSVTLNSVDGKDVLTFSYQSDACCATFVDDQVLAIGSSDHTVRLWDARDSSHQSNLAFQQSARVCDLQFQQDLLLSADSSGGLAVWDPKMPAAPRIETRISANARITCMTAGPPMSRKPHISSENGENLRNDLQSSRRQRDADVARNESLGDQENAASEAEVESNAITSVGNGTESSEAVSKGAVSSGRVVKPNPQSKKVQLKGTASQRKRRKRKASKK